MRRILLALAALALAAPAFAQTPPRPPTCEASEHRAFDFWIGEWDVFVTGGEQLAGRSTIASEDRGCVITEHYESTRAPFTGRSLNMYDRAERQWVQVWMDSQGDITRFAGAATPTGMQLTAPNDVSPSAQTPHFTRMTFTRNADGTVRQHGEASPDGEAWTTTYDFTYRPRR